MWRVLFRAVGSGKAPKKVHVTVLIFCTARADGVRFSSVFYMLIFCVLLLSRTVAL